MSKLELKEFERKPFAVDAVEVTLENIEEVATWCKGTLDSQETKMLGTTVRLPVIKLQGQGKDKEKVFTVNIGCFVVDHKGSFRMYKPAQFHQMFQEKRKPVYRNEPGSNADAKAFFAREIDSTPIFQSAKEDVVEREIAAVVYEEQETGS